MRLKQNTYSIEFYRHKGNVIPVNEFEIHLPFRFMAVMLFKLLSLIYTRGGVLMLHWYKRGHHYKTIKYKYNA